MTLNEQMEAVNDRDRRRLVEGRSRWYIRATEQAELDKAAEQIASSAGIPVVPIFFATNVLVIASPSRQIRVRFFFDGPQDRRPDDITPMAVRLLSANTDEEFGRRISHMAGRVAGGGQ
jgi:hypothetical protein